MSTKKLFSKSAFKQALHCPASLYYYYDRYQSLIHGLIECLTAGNPDEKKFYEALWLFIENGPVILPEEDDRLFAWLFAWRDRKTPYFQMKEGMEMSGTVRNVVDFGAFVDIGVKQDGLVHISQLSDSFVKHPMDVVSVGDNVKVRILSIDKEKGKISLTMKL